jgi:hypothetical protein
MRMTKAWTSELLGRVMTVSAETGICSFPTVTNSRILRGRRTRILLEQLARNGAGRRSDGIGREEARPLRRRRAQRCHFVRSIAEERVLDEGTAHVEAKLIADERRLLALEEVSRPQRAIAMEFPQRPMKFVGPRLGNDAQDTAREPTKFGTERIPDEAEFFDAI